MIFANKRNEIETIVAMFCVNVNGMVSFITFKTVITIMLLIGSNDKANHLPQLFESVSFEDNFDKRVQKRKYRILLKITPD